jgi:hypothetical protein
MSEGATRIITGALVQLGEDPVTSIDLDPAPSRLTKILPHLQDAIDAVLVKYGWLCALEYTTLTPSDLVPANWRFPYHYLVPEGGLRFWEVSRTSGWERGVWQKEDASTLPVLRAKEGGEINVSYVKRREADALDANVRDAVVFELAARACRSMNGSVERALELRRLADQAVITAQATDGQDAKADDVMFEDWLGNLRAFVP